MKRFVKSWEEIKSTLCVDFGDACCGNITFVKSMLEYCGKEINVEPVTDEACSCGDLYVCEECNFYFIGQWLYRKRRSYRWNI